MGSRSFTRATSNQLSETSNVGAVIVKAGYGEKVYREHGQDLARLNRIRSEMITGVYQKFWLVDVFPFCASHYWLPALVLHPT